MQDSNLNGLITDLHMQIEKASNLSDLESVKVQALGKNGSITQLMKNLNTLSEAERKLAGQVLNSFKQEITKTLEEKKAVLEEQALNAQLKSDPIDITLPTRPVVHGRIHPITQTTEEILTIFAQMGFELAEGPDIEDDWHNFEALNIPPSHPSRQMQASFFIKDAPSLLRTQTSGVQIRTMENQKPPIKIVAPGRTYRVDSDATHSPMFHQIEGFIIDTEVNLAHLKGVLTEFMHSFFETKEITLRFRPSYFPFTEPSFEVDVGGELAHAIGKEWLELLGCGMVDPKVLENCGLNPDVYQGFAFGCGIDRLAMLKYGIPDIRSFFEGDERWIRHYGFMPQDIPSITNGLSGTGGNKR